MMKCLQLWQSIFLIRSVLAISNQFDLEFHQMDVKTAFLNGNLEEEIFLRRPEDLRTKDHPNMISKLRKSLLQNETIDKIWDTRKMMLIHTSTTNDS